MKLMDLAGWLDDYLRIDGVEDVSLNGLQLGDIQLDVSKVVCAVDAGLEVFEKAVDAGAQVLCVHHGLFWGKPLAITETHYQRVKFLIDHNLALYAAHLPLDQHAEVGNNIGMVHQLGLQSVEPFGLYGGTAIGWQGVFGDSLTLPAVMDRLNVSVNDAHVWNFGPEDIKTVAMISGDAPNEVRQAMAAGVDLYITGEPSHALYHECKEAGINVLFAGHYHTETFGPSLLAQKINTELGIEAEFIDVPTRL